MKLRRSIDEASACSLLDHDQLVIEDGRDLQHRESPIDADGTRGFRDEQPRVRFGRAMRGQRNFYFEGPDANQFIERRTPGGLAGQVDEMQQETARLLVEMTVEQSRA